MPDRVSRPATIRGWRRFDTLFVRLFLLLWVTLVVSTLLGFEAFRAMNDRGPGPQAGGRPGGAGVLLMPSLPPLRALTGRDERRRPPEFGAGASTPIGVEESPFRREARPPPESGSAPVQSQDGPLDARATPGAEGAGPGMGPMARRPVRSIWIDLAVRVLVIGLAAAWAARWLSAPVRDLGGAARHLREALQPASGRMLSQAPPQVDERRGSAEIRATAQVFNDMARQLKADFDAQRLLLATVSHDLRTPLSRLRLRLANLDATPAGALQDIEEMNELLEGLLDLFREPVAGSARAPSRVDVAALVQAVIDDLPSGPETVTFEASDAVAACGTMPLRRIVQNLIGNAVRHSGDVRVSVRTQASPGSRPQVVVRIDDRGPGLTPEQLAQAGTPFVRWEAASPSGTAAQDDAARRAGLGLGLHIARALAEREGGELRLAAREGGGLSAEVRIPAAA